MAQEYLPAPSNVRLADLMKEHNTGYDNASKFSEAFRKRYGTTPSQYRTHANGLAKRSREIRME